MMLQICGNRNKDKKERGKWLEEFIWEKEKTVENCSKASNEKTKEEES